MGSYENETWARFGKVCAWIAGIAATGGALYWIGTSIYDSGHDAGERVGQEKTAEEWKRGLDETINDHQKEVSKWTQKGRLIPEGNCFHYFEEKKIDGADATGVTGCGFTLNYFPVANKVVLWNENYSVTLSAGANNQRLPFLEKKVKEQWETINLAP